MLTSLTRAMRNQIEAAMGLDWVELKTGQFWWVVRTTVVWSMKWAHNNPVRANPLRKTPRFTLNGLFHFNELAQDKTRTHSIMWLKFLPKPYVARFRFLLAWSRTPPCPRNTKPQTFDKFSVRVRSFKCTEPRGSADTIAGNFMFVETDKTPSNDRSAERGEFIKLSLVKKAHPVLMAKMSTYGLQIPHKYYAFCMDSTYEYGDDI